MPTGSTPGHRSSLERVLENGLFMSRWLMAPFYVGLVLALAMLLMVFVEELVTALPHILQASSEDIILTVLALIDLWLAENFVLIVIFFRDGDFVVKFDVEDRRH